ncbi:MAG: cytochrome c [Planctomycetia bacterium]|nr:cytochrome c [Planctomycetia bacterium]
MKAALLAAGLVMAMAGTAGVLVYADRGEEEDERVEKLMEKTHEGKRSPYRQLKAQAEAPMPVWPIVGATLPRFDAMSRALLESEDDEIRASADGYVEAVKEITAATKAQDSKALKDAFQSLSQSCGDCHFKGGVGGELDD